MKNEISASKVDAQVDALAGSEPRKLEVGQTVYGRHHDVWYYRDVPSGMRKAAPADIIPGRMVLYRVETGPDTGGYYTCVVSPFTLPILMERAAGGTVWLKAAKP